MAKRISDFLSGAMTGGGAGGSALGGLAMGGMFKGGAGLALGATSPWAWGLLGGGALLGGISSLLSEDSPEEKLAKEQLKQAKQLNARRTGTATALGSMFSGAKLAPSPMASGRLE